MTLSHANTILISANWEEMKQSKVSPSGRIGWFPGVNMASVSEYWQFVQLQATGQVNVQKIEAAKTFFQQQFPDWAERDRAADASRQRGLFQQMQQADEAEQSLPGICLRCLISNQILRVCRQLEAQFGSSHGFKTADLLPFVLDDRLTAPRAKSHPSSEFQPFAVRILQSFEPERGSLTTWIIRLVRNHRELNRFLLEQGVYMVSDWAILNDTQPRQLPRILGEFHALTPIEIEQASQLLRSYHAVYRRDRVEQRQSGSVGRCMPPTVVQLQEIARYCQALSKSPLAANLGTTTTETTLSALQSLASQLRQYRIAVRGGVAQTESLDQPEMAGHARTLQADSPDADHSAENQFLDLYRRQFEQCLEQVIADVVRDRVQYLQKRKPQSTQAFIDALRLFHCQGQSMNQIAQQIGLQQQYQVTRLLKLKQFRADVRQRLLLRLRDRVLDYTKTQPSLPQMHDLEQQVEAALDHQISDLMQAAELEASTPQERPFQNLFARKLCHHLDTWSLSS